MTTSEHVDNTVDKDESTERKGVFIPGAVWPDPKKANFNPERRDPFAMHDRGAPMKHRRYTDVQDEAKPGDDSQ